MIVPNFETRPRVASPLTGRRHRRPRPLRPGLAFSFGLIAIFVVAVACGGGESSEATLGDDGFDEVEPIEISEAAALLHRARQPGLEDRIRICRRILQDYPEAPEAQEALHLLAQTHQARDEFDEAYARYTEQVERYPGSYLNVPAHEYLWNYEKKVAEDPEAYRAALGRAVDDIALFLRNNPAQWDSSYALELANTQLEAQDYDAALATYERIVATEEEPDEAEAQVRITAQFHVGNIHLERGEAELAIEAFERSRSLVDRFQGVLPPVALEAYRQSVARSIEQARTTDASAGE